MIEGSFPGTLTTKYGLYIGHAMYLLGPKLLLVMGCVKLGEKNFVQLPFVGEQNAN